MIKMKWLNEPTHWQADEHSLRMSVDAATDFWRITHYGFIRDSGHFYYTETDGDFEATMKVLGKYDELYHQAGLMIRLNEKVWIKTGIEYVDGLQQVSAVVTRDFSDWSVAPCPGSPPAIWLKLLRKADFVQLDYSLNGTTYSLLRLAHFPAHVSLQVGLMAAAPGKKDFEVVFENFRIVPVP
jgi:regulation of enolase protein 1 (concanavalin A-like superfamily)